jgi:putative nucleotidyltransferase with HDIG domain
MLAGALEKNWSTTSRWKRELLVSGARPRSRILVVDDEEAICLLLNEKLLSAGYQSCFCTSAPDALELISRDEFDAIISDLNMPYVTGIDLLEATRQHLPHAAFLMATGVNDISVSIAAMKKGAADYLLKPFQLDAVIVSLERALGIKRLEAELENYRKHLEDMVEQRTKQLEAALRRIEMTYNETLEALGAALDLRDNETAGHSRRVTLYSLEIAKAMECSKELSRQLTWAAFLHDIGKIGIPDSILLKTRRLTSEEMAIMQTHVRIGFNLLSQIAFLAPASEIVLTHHERFDGTGYPQGLMGDEIPLGARIFAVADTLDAITSDRPYRGARPYTVAIQEIQAESGKQFDPKVVEGFLSIEVENWERIRQSAAMTSPDVQRAFSQALRVGQEASGDSFKQQGA